MLSKNDIQMFVLTQLEDIYEKFKDYWQKCEDIIPGVVGKSYQNDSEVRNQNSRVSQNSGGSNIN